MINNLKPYAEYIDIDLPWLDTLPASWNILRGKGVFFPIDVRSDTGKEELLSVSALDGVIPRRLTNVTMFKAKSYIGHKLCWPGDLVVNSIWAWMQGLGVAQHHGLISSAYSVYRPRTIYSDYARYFHYLLRSAVYKWELQTRSKGVWTSRLQLLDTSFMDMPILLPPPDEQAAIVRFLDYTTRRLENAIRAKRKTIALLKEQKQAIIHRAVTRGLDPNVRIKPSGIPWLGEVPEHWELRRLRTLIHRIDQGVSPQAVGFLADDSSWGVLKSGCINHGVFRETEHKQLAKSFRIDLGITVKVGDVLVSRACGSPKLVGSVGKVESLNYRLILSDKTFRPVFRDCVDVDFMVFAMNCRYYRFQVEQAISGAEGLANNLPLTSLRSFMFVVPPLREAQQISEYLREELRTFTTSITSVEQTIVLLQEYRTRLISDVVTGKLDVREAAKQLPTEYEEIAVKDTDDCEVDELELDDTPMEAVI